MLGDRSVRDARLRLALGRCMAVRTKEDRDISISTTSNERLEERKERRSTYNQTPLHCLQLLVINLLPQNPSAQMM